MIPPWIWFGVKNMLNSTISMSYPDVVIACIEHKVSLEAICDNWGSVRSTIIIWRIIPGGWLITITANHSNYLVCDRANTQSVTVVKVVNCKFNYCNALVIKWIYNIVLFEWKNVGCSFFITFNWCICSLFWRWSPTAGFTTQAEKFPGPFFAQERCVNLFNHLVRKADVAGCCSAGSVLFVDMRLPRIQCRWFVLSEVVFTLSWCRSINTIPAS